MRAQRIVSAAIVLAALGACGGGDSGGGSPTTPSPTTITSLSISPSTALLRIKGAETFTANAVMSNGTSSMVSATWRTSSPAIATIDANGKATAVASGSTVITAEYQGTQATRDLRVVPDYHGTWRGRLNVVGCSDEGDWRTAAFCNELGMGDIDDVSLIASQQNALITGTLDIGGLAGPITGSMASDGTLAVTGEYTTSVEGLAVKIGVVEWQSVSGDNARMTGRFGFTIRSELMNGIARVQSELLNMNKTSSAALMGVRSGEGRLIAAMRAAARRH